MADPTTSGPTTPAAFIAKWSRALFPAYASLDPAGLWPASWADLWLDSGPGQPLPPDHPLAAQRAEVDQKVLANLLRLNREKTTIGKVPPSLPPSAPSGLEKKKEAELQVRGLPHPGYSSAFGGPRRGEDRLQATGYRPTPPGLGLFNPFLNGAVHTAPCRSRGRHA